MRSAPDPVEPANEVVAISECAWKVLSPAPGAGDPRWEGHAPVGGRGPLQRLQRADVLHVRRRGTWCGPGDSAATTAGPRGAGAAGRGQLDLPDPTITRSPDAKNSDPALGGAPYTWVQLWTWVWTEPQTWAPASVTVAAGGVSVTATGTPVALVFDPGDGGDPVTCDGPGPAVDGAGRQRPAVAAAGAGTCTGT